MHLKVSGGCVIFYSLAYKRMKVSYLSRYSGYGDSEYEIFIYTARCSVVERHRWRPFVERRKYSCQNYIIK